MPVDALATLDARASAGMILTPMLQYVEEGYAHGYPRDHWDHQLIIFLVVSFMNHTASLVTIGRMPQYQLIYWNRYKDTLWISVSILKYCCILAVPISLFYSVGNKKTRTTRTPDVLRIPLMPHDYPYYWFISDPKSKKKGKKVSRIVDFFSRWKPKNQKNLQKNLNFRILL